MVNPLRIAHRWRRRTRSSQLALAPDSKTLAVVYKDALYFTPDNKFFYAVASEDNVMTKIDVAKMELVSTMPVAKASMFFAIKEGDSYPPTE